MYKRLSYCIYIVGDSLVNTNNYSLDPMRLVQKSFDLTIQNIGNYFYVQQMILANGKLQTI